MVKSSTIQLVSSIRSADMCSTLCLAPLIHANPCTRYNLLNFHTRYFSAARHHHHHQGSSIIVTHSSLVSFSYVVENPFNFHSCHTFIATPLLFKVFFSTRTLFHPHSLDFPSCANTFHPTSNIELVSESRILRHSILSSLEEEKKSENE